MKQDIVLIVTSKLDSHADRVIDNLNVRGKGDKVIRLNTEDFWLNTEVSTNGSSFDIYIKDSHRSFNSEQVLSVWFRRPQEVEVSYPDNGSRPYITSFKKLNPGYPDSDNHNYA